MEISLVSESIKFMFLGMGVVFSFLTVMIFVLKGQSVLLTKFFPQKEKELNIMPISNSATTDSAKIAAVIAAVQHHKNLKG